MTALRCAGAPRAGIGPVIQAQNLLGEPLWRPARRTDFPTTTPPGSTGSRNGSIRPMRSARRLGDTVDPAAAVEPALGPLASEETRAAVRRREPAPGLDAAVHGARIQKEMIMPARRFSLHLPGLLARAVAPRSAVRLRGALLLGVSAPRARAEGRDPASWYRAARHARRSRGDRSGRRSRLRSAPRRQGVAPEQAVAGLPLDRFFALNSAIPIFPSTLSRRRRRASSTRSQRPIGNAPIFDRPGRTSKAGWPGAGHDRFRLARPRARRDRPGRRVDGRDAQGGKAFAIGPVTPLVVRGSAPVLSWTPRASRRPATIR